MNRKYCVIAGFLVAALVVARSVAGTGRQPLTSVHFRRLLLPLGLFLLPVLVSAAPETFPGLGRKWQHYRSPNFELYSANSDRASRDVLEKMELLRALFLDTFKLKVRLPQPVTIYYFDRQADFDGYRPRNYRSNVRYVGFCNNYPDRTVITLAPVGSDENIAEVVYHEYIHCLFRITEQNPAPWFNEGVAELFSTMKEDGEWLQLGHPVVGRVIDLKNGRMMPFDQLFSVTRESPVFRNSGHSGIFYAQSWAFLHYCRFGVNKIPPEKVALFLRVAGSPETQERPEEFRNLCRELLGMDYPELLKELERYIAFGKFTGRKAKRPEISPRKEYTVRPVTREEMNLQLAELALRQFESPYGNLHVREQLERAPTARLHEVMGSAAIRADETDVAREHWRRAVELGTDNAAIFRELGRLESNAIFGQFDLDYRMPAQRANGLRHLLHKSIECAPEQSMGYEMLAWVEALSDKPDIAALNQVQQRFQSLNDRGRTLLALVIVRMRLGDTEGALKLLDQLEGTRPSDWVRFCAELTRARLEDRPVDQDKLPPASRRQPGMRMSPPRINLPH